MIPRHGAEHGARLGLARGSAAEGNQLIEQRQRVAHAAVGRLSDQLHRRRIKDNPFGFEDLPHALGKQRNGQALQIELQATRQHGHRQLLRVGRREQELHMRRRLLESLQERIERMRREHVHFVDEVDLVAAARRRVLHVVEELTGVIDLGARCGIHFQKIDESAGINLAAGRAFPAGLGRDALLAVQAFRKNPRDGRLADAARAGEEKRVMHAAARQRIDERASHVLLPHELGEFLRAPFARQRDIAHRSYQRLGASKKNRTSAARASLRATRRSFGTRRRPAPA